MRLKRNPDTGETMAIVALLGAVGYGVYVWIKGKGLPVTLPSPPATFRPADTELGRVEFAVYVRPPTIGDQLPAGNELARVNFAVNVIRAPGVIPPETPPEPLPEGEFKLRLKTDGDWGNAAIRITPWNWGTQYDYGTVVQLEAIAGLVTRFLYWDVDGEFLDTNQTINFVVFAPHTITAHFELKSPFGG